MLAQEGPLWPRKETTTVTDNPLPPDGPSPGALPPVSAPVVPRQPAPTTPHLDRRLHEGGAARGEGADRRESGEVEEAAEAVGGRRHRAAHAGRRHRRSLRARGARRQDGRHRLQPEAGQADGDRVERDGPGGEPRRRQADCRHVRELRPTPARECDDRRRRCGRCGGGRGLAGAWSPRPRRLRYAGRSGDRDSYFAVDSQATRRCCSRFSPRCRRAAISTTICRARSTPKSYLRWAAADGCCVAIGDAVDRVGNLRCRRRTAARRGRRFRNSDAVQPGRSTRCRCGTGIRRSTGTIISSRRSAGSGTSSRRTGDMLAEVAARAAAERVSYLELMVTPGRRASARRAGSRPAGIRISQAARHAAAPPGFRDAVVERGADSSRRRPRRAQRAAAQVRTPLSRIAGCRVTDPLHLPGQPRAARPQAVFGQMLAGFEIAAADPRVVELNLVQPEDDPAAVRDFRCRCRCSTTSTASVSRL